MQKKYQSMQHHNLSLFGQKTGMLLDSAKAADPFLYLRLIRKKADGTWEKPSLNEGKAVKFNLLELCALTRLLHQPTAKWTTVHKHQAETTSIVVDKTATACSWKIGEYVKTLAENEIDLLGRLLDHILTEKIEHATGQRKLSPTNEPNVSEDPSFEANNDVDNLPAAPDPINPFDDEAPRQIPVDRPLQIDPIAWITQLKVEGDFVQVPGIITANRPQAFNVQINGLRPIWVPKSTVKSPDHIEGESALWIKKWFIEKKLPDLFGTAA